MNIKPLDYLSYIITNNKNTRLERRQAKEKILNKNSIKPIGKFLSFINDRVLMVLIIILVLANAFIYYYRIYFPVDSDFGPHMLFTRYLIGGHLDQIPLSILAHPGLEIFLAGLYYLSFHKVALGTMLAGILTISQVMTAVVIYIWLGSGVKRYWDMGRAFIAGTLTFAAPVMLLVYHDKLFYFGYIDLANYHNPTIIFLRPFALISFFLGVRAFNGINNSWKMILASSILVLISALIKPNYLLCILPALMILAMWWKIQHKVVDYRYLLFGFLIPSIVILGIQWWLAYFSPVGNQAGIIFSPLGVESAFSGNLLPKFLLSVFFPVSILIFDFRKFKDNPDLLLALIGFLVSSFQVYLLAENGNRFYDGNFRWGAQVMLFIWFVISAKELLKRVFDENKSNGGKIALSTIYLTHIAAGIIFYVHCFLSTSYA